MGVQVNSLFMYALADALGMALDIDAKGQVTGSTDRDVYIGKIPVPFNLTVVSSQLRDKSHMLMLRGPGNLAVLAIAEPAKKFDVVTVHLLNLAKMDKVDGWLEAKKPATPADARALLQPAIARSFEKISKTCWATAA
jgi:hypothetical protein